MIVKKTGSDFSITNPRAEIIFSGSEVRIVRQQSQSGRMSDYVISEPGEYDIEAISLVARNPFPTFFIEVDGFHVGFFSHPIDQIPEEDLSLYEQVEIMFVAGELHDLVVNYAPLIVIPLNNIEQLCAKLNIEIPEARKSLSLKNSSDLPEETEVVNLG